VHGEGFFWVAQGRSQGSEIMGKRGKMLSPYFSKEGRRVDGPAVKERGSTVVLHKPRMRTLTERER